MHYLPAIELFGKTVALPLGRGGIELLTIALVADKTPRSLLSSLICNPPLALYLACQCVERENDQSGPSGNGLASEVAQAEITLGSVFASCSADRLGEILGGEFVDDQPSQNELQSMVNLAGLARERVLSRLASKGDSIDSVSNQMVLDDPGVMASLLKDAPRWCELGKCSDSQAERSGDRFQSWLDERIRQAAESTSPVTGEEHPEVLAHWSDSSSEFNWLPQLIAKAQRLNRLETQFEEELHTSKMKAMKELAYGASHEINNPLANISSRAQTLMREERDPDRQDKLAAINRQAFRAHEMIADMMLFAHPPRIDASEIRLQEVIDEVVEESGSLLTSQGTDVKVTIEGSELTMVADRTQLTVAIKALVRNAAESLGSGGLIKISAWMDDLVNVANISVHDDGPGISGEIRTHLFEPFFSGREAGRGLGFGLSKVWRIVTEHGGDVLVDSNPSQRGTSLTLRFPQNR